MRFFSDNTATACPEILTALEGANRGLAKPYGEDEWTARLDGAFSAFFDTEARAFAVATGTAANSLSLATLSPPYGAIFAHQEAHIAVDECGAPGFFSGGAQLALLPGEHGRLEAATFRAALGAYPPGDVHKVQPAALSITQATELGTCYRRENGALAAEAVVFFDPALVGDFELRRKRAGHLLSKSRYVAAQLLAYLETGVWRRNAGRANALAQAIGRAAGAALLHPVEANEVFVGLGAERRRALRAAGFEFYDWGPESAGDARFVASWDQPEGDVPALCEALGRS
ncbi:MAG: low specificity L-threonine aldolase [Gammaproteobacteria bacterium]|nr:MAG: low specificity L-threonine aldolase [Gammaproteobacteria bacterium]